MSSVVCRLCGSAAGEIVLDLGETPLANSLVPPAFLDAPEPRYPLRTWRCAACGLLQLDATVPPERMFGHYLYFSSVSESWLAHCGQYAEQIAQRLHLNPQSQVVEIGSNDGYLLNFFRRMEIPALGIEPAANVARAAIDRGIPTEVAFFDAAVARRLREQCAADLIVANNVFAHVPDINGFVEGLALLLKPEGTATIEFPHLSTLIAERQFDTIYHEHVFYFSLATASAALERHGLRVYDADRLPTHGGSLRLYVCHRAATFLPSAALLAVSESERSAGLDRVETYRSFAATVAAVKNELVEFLTSAESSGKRVVAYGAAAKGVSLLNSIGPAAALIHYVVDRSPHKQGLHLPGSHLPIRAPAQLFETRPDYLLLLAWNLQEEIRRQMAGIREWGGRFVVPIPTLTVLP